MANLKHETDEIRIKVPRKLGDKLSAMADAYGVSRQSVILMILGQTITGVETMTRALTNAATNLVDVPDDKKDILDALNK